MVNMLSSVNWGNNLIKVLGDSKCDFSSTVRAKLTMYTPYDSGLILEQIIYTKICEMLCFHTWWMAYIRAIWQFGLRFILAQKLWHFSLFCFP